MTMQWTAVCAALLTASLAGQSPAFWRLRDAPDDLRPAISRADLVILAMQNEVLRELNHARARDGEAPGLAFCHVDVEGVIRRVSREGGVAAGRTSDRLRNPANAPRPWAARLVAAHAGGTAKTIDGYAVDLGTRVGVLRPMVEQPTCGGCHGTPDRLAPGVALILKQRYPADRATGFRDGEIRGWFWVEMPKSLRGGS